MQQTVHLKFKIREVLPKHAFSYNRYIYARGIINYDEQDTSSRYSCHRVRCSTLYILLLCTELGTCLILQPSTVHHHITCDLYISKRKEIVHLVKLLRPQKKIVFQI